MRRFAAGLGVAAALIAAVWWAMSSTESLAPAPSRDGMPAAKEQPEAPGTPRKARSRARRAADARPSAPEQPVPRREAPSNAARFPPGEAVLRIGDRYVFGEGAVLLPGDACEGDVVCTDIGIQDATLRCPQGSQTAHVPPGALGLPVAATEAAALLLDAGTGFSHAQLRLGATRFPDAPGFGVVRSAAGPVFRVVGVEFSGEGGRLDRFVRIAYEDVPSREGGGVLAVTVAQPAPNAWTLHQLDAVMAVGGALPGTHVAGKDFASLLKGRYERVGETPEELVLTRGRFLVLDRALTTSVEFNAYSGLVAPRGIAETGRVNVRSYTGLSVRGPMAGEIETNSYAYVHVAGDVTGKLHVRSYATVVIDGDIRGEVTISSYATILLRGRVLGSLKFACGYVDLWLEQYTAAWEIPAMPGRIGGNASLHLRASDLEGGKHTKVQGWGKVIVGEEAWATIAR